MTPVTPSETFTFVQMADAHFNMDEGHEHNVSSFRQAVRQINNLGPDFVLVCGGDLGITATEHTAFVAFNKVTAELNMPCHCAVGNHDLLRDSPAHRNLELYRQRMGKDYFSFDHKGHTFIITNTQLWKNPVTGETEAEQHDRWVVETLTSASQQGRQVFLVGHYPLFRKDVDEEEDAFILPLAKRKWLLGLFEQYGVVAVLTGHTHAFVANEHKGIQLVSCEATSWNWDDVPPGFRVWHVPGTQPPRHEFVAIDNQGLVGGETITGEAE